MYAFFCFGMFDSLVYQSAAAQKDHEDNEGLKICVFHNGEAGPSHVRPEPPFSTRHLYFQKGTSLVTL